jgi:hypothetical protein
MSGGGISEGVVEQAALDCFRSLGYATLPGAVLAPGGTAPERSSYDQVVLTGRLRDAAQRHEQLALSVAEAAIYDAIVQNDAAVLQMGDATLKKIAVDLVWAVQQSATIDWSVKESVPAAMRSKTRRLLAKYDYPPDQEDKAVELVLEQAELFAAHG